MPIRFAILTAGNIAGQMVLLQKVEAGKTIINDMPRGVYIVNGQKIIL